MSDRIISNRRVKRGRIVYVMVVSAFLLAGCGSGVSNQRRSVTPSATDVGDTVLASNFPTDAADWEAGQQFVVFEKTVIEKAEDQCLVGDGFRPLPSQSFSVQPENVDFPDLAAIERSGTFVNPNSVPSPPDPTTGMSAAERAAYQAAAQRCGNRVDALVGPLINLSQSPVVVAWDDQLNRITASRQVQAETSQVLACLGRAGAMASSLEGFFLWLDSQTVPKIENGQRSRALKIEHRLARVFVTCVAPLVALRDRLRMQAREAFYAAHAQAINGIRHEADALAAALSRRFGVRIGSQAG